MEDETTNTAPRRIWLQVDAGARSEERTKPFPADIDGVTWHNEEIGGLEVDYLRSDISRDLLRELKAAEEWMSEVAAAVAASELGCYDGPPLSGVRAAITKATGKCCDV